MLEASATRILDEVGPSDIVVDVGGGGRPHNRADWIIDLLPYEERSVLGHQGPDDERFTRDTWIRRDLCDREPYPFDDKQVDFAICSHTLEDVRDPIWICSELVRIAKRGYVEVPSRLEEQSWGVHGDWPGWSHHRWLIDPTDGGLLFTHKPAVLTRRSSHFPRGFAQKLSEEQKVLTLWWEDSFHFAERVFHDFAEFDEYLDGFVREHAPPRRLFG